MAGFIGSLLITFSFFLGLACLGGYYLYATFSNPRVLTVTNWVFGLKGLLIAVSSGILLSLLISHQFNYYYVYNYTSSNLDLRYVISAFWGGQEGSFLLWILFSEILGLGLMKWVQEPYKGPVLFFFSLNIVFLLSMILGLDIFGLTFGASPFRSIADAFPDAPFLMSNPDFVPPDGKGLNDLLKSPWMIIHPPILFLGFSMMAIPYCFAMAALWKGSFRTWIDHAIPWTLAANLSLFIAVFLGGYWAYVTLSFGGYWAWDPVENASIIPWFIGTAGIHFMFIQRKKGSSNLGSIVFAILAYAAVLYESFLTRSGVLGDASVHSFTDLGLYAQLLLFMLIVLAAALALIIYRYNSLKGDDNEYKLLSREFLVTAGAITLFMIALVITIGTSSPILGRFFTENPTPPEINFYNQWTMPLAILAAFLTVVGQFIFWKRHTIEELAGNLIPPVILAIIGTVVILVMVQLSSLYYIIFLFSALFALIGNAVILTRLAIKNLRLTGGSLSHVGFSILLVGLLASSAYENNLLDTRTLAYNQAILAGNVPGDDGLPLQETVDMLELNLNEPKIVNGKYLFTYTGHELSSQARPGQHAYEIKVERVGEGGTDSGTAYSLFPEVYPLSTGSSINWSVDVDVHAGLFSDVYMYVAGSSWVELKNREYESRRANPHAITSSSPDEKEWVLLMAIEKPFVSLVWLGVFCLMAGFSISVLRHRNHLKLLSSKTD